ncbi:MAG: hypothetical protein GQ535_13660 [Rhodobacteraceae bacterium]|nr:hypothetical protein [Paracoccaceae bacterium]
MKLAFRALYTIIAWSALAAQLWLILDNPENTTLGGIIRFFSFFTLLSNSLAAVVMTASLTRAKWSHIPAIRGGIVVYIALVSTVYHAVLAQLLDLSGLAMMVDIALHTVLPAMFILDWALFSDKIGLKPRHAVIWLWFPVLYCTYSLLRGAAIGWYPYPFLDPVSAGGYGAVAVNIAVLVAMFLLAGLLVVWQRRTR